MRERLADAPELLDEPAHDNTELEQSLAQVAEVNRWLGGLRAILRALGSLLTTGRDWRVLDIGTGSADIPLAIDEWARARGITVHVMATDLHPQMCTIAAAHASAASHIDIGAADARALPFRDRSVDVVLLSLTLHHFEPADQVLALREAARVASRAVIVNELERGWPNYIGARLLAQTRWRGNRLTRHDGPLSVLRAFRRKELAALARAANVPIESLQRHYFYRLVMVLDARRR